MSSAKLKRVISLVGPISFAVANFALALALQRVGGANDFGTFAFLQVLIATGMSVSSGLFGSPLIFQISRAGADAVRVLSTFSRVNLLFSAIAGIAAGLVILMLGSGALASGLGGIAVFLSLMRWFIRSAYLARNSLSEAKSSDLVYSILTVAALGGLLLSATLSLESAIAVQLLVTLASLSPYLSTLSGTFVASEAGPLSEYRKSLRDQGAWALLAAGATNLTANIHAYAVTFIFGAAAFAPLALGTMIFRPLGVILTGLVQFERPRMARSIASGSVEAVEKDVRFVQHLVALAWLGNALVAAFLVIVIPGEVGKDGYDIATLQWAVALVAVLVLVRGLREPKTAALQGCGAFKVIARASVSSAAVAIVAVAISIAAFPGNPATALLGALLGEAVNFSLIRIAYRREIAAKTIDFQKVPASQ